MQYFNSTQEIDGFYLSSFHLIVRRYKGAGKAEFLVNVVEIDNEVTEEKMLETLKVAYKTLSDKNIERIISFTNITGCMVYFKIVPSNDIAEKVDTVSYNSKPIGNCIVK